MTIYAVETRFWSKVKKDGTVPAHRPELGSCWIWDAGTMGSGYGQFYISRGQRKGAHIVAYELAKGKVPEGLDLDHLCHPGDGSCPRVRCPHRLCVNPDHLEPVTRLENLRRGNTFISAQMKVTHCPAGHEYTPENTRTRIAPSGNEMHSCRQCDRDRQKASQQGKKPGWHNAIKTHCPQEHEYSRENTRISPEGWRHCITCLEERRIKRKTDKKV